MGFLRAAVVGGYCALFEALSVLSCVTIFMFLVLLFHYMHASQYVKFDFYSFFQMP